VRQISVLIVNQITYTPLIMSALTLARRAPVLATIARFAPALAALPGVGALVGGISSLLELIPPIVLAVPKHKVTHSRKSMRSAHKGIKNKTSECWKLGVGVGRRKDGQQGEAAVVRLRERKSVLAMRAPRRVSRRGREAAIKANSP
jgi:hypothetical protein